MDWIIPSCELTEKLGGGQKPRAGVRYRQTKHCITCPCTAGTLAYHTLTGALVLLRQGEDWESERDALIENRFLVPEDADERVYADQLSSIALMLGRKGEGRTAFTILTTTDCNARCYYCYELGIRRIPMTEQTAQDTADYITRVCKGKPVSISWFGGEPLYNRPAIEQICARLRENHIEYESGMVSNGFYLDAGTAQHAAAAWNLKKVQITLDGPEQEYNRIKAYIDRDENPYRRVMGNIRGALDAGIRVVIRLNMDASNAASLLRLADDLGGTFRDDPRPEVYVALLHAFAGKIHEHDTDDEAEQAFFALCDRLDAHGLLRRKELQKGPRTV